MDTVVRVELDREFKERVVSAAIAVGLMPPWVDLVEDAGDGEVCFLVGEILTEWLERQVAAAGRRGVGRAAARGMLVEALNEMKG